MKPKILFFTAISLVSISISCNKLNSSETVDPIHAGLADWTEATHSKTDPNYDVVFPQDKINTLEMTEVAASWPLIRYLADDATYYAKYKSYVKDFNDNYFTTAKMNAIFDKNYNLISSSVMQEVPPYSYLSNTATFTNAITQLKAHVATRNQAVATFLK